MAEFDARTREIVYRLQAVRVKMLSEHPFYAVLLLHLRFALDVSTPTLYTDGERIAFNPDFVEHLSETELRFVLMHEVLHVALGHCEMDDGTMDHTLFNIACDIVVNSNILYSFSMAPDAVRVNGEELVHTILEKEGYAYTVTEVYQMMMDHHLTAEDFFPDQKPPAEAPGRGGKGKGRGSPAAEGGPGPRTRGSKGGRKQSSPCFDDHSFWEGATKESRDEAAKWAERMVNATEITRRVEELYSSMGGTACGKAPLGADRLLKELLSPQIDWRTIIETFIQEDITDYSFTPPDRRYADSPFFLPDFNEREERVKNIVFLVDTSGSMSDGDIQAAYTEIKGAIDQFDGKMEGYVVAADTVAYGFVPFGEETDIFRLIPRGGGGTDFAGPIRYVLEQMREDPPSSMIYITDGLCSFPEESIAEGIPFLWLITGDVTPPWGRVARIKSQKST